MNADKVTMMLRKDTHGCELCLMGNVEKSIYLPSHRLHQT